MDGNIEEGLALLLEKQGTSEKAGIDGRACLPDAETADKEQYVCPGPERQGLVIAAMNEIYCIREDGKPILVAKRRIPVLALCEHQGQLFDGGYDGKINHTLEGRAIAQREAPVVAMCSDGNTLYDSMVDKWTRKGKVSAMGIGQISDAVIWRMHSSDGKVYGSNIVDVTDILTGKPMPEWRYTSALGTFKGHLFRAFGNCCETEVEDALTHEHIAKRHGLVMNFAECNGELYDAGYHFFGGAVHKTFADKDGTRPISELRMPINAMCAVPLEIWEELVKKGGGN